MKENLRVFVVCSYALSSSFLANRMQELAIEKNFDLEVEFVTPEKLRENLDKCDVVLLSPQIRFSKSVFVELFEPFGVPVVTIPMEIYGMVDAEKAIELAFASVRDMEEKGDEI